MLDMAGATTEVPNHPACVKAARRVGVLENRVRQHKAYHNALRAGRASNVCRGALVVFNNQDSAKRAVEDYKPYNGSL